MQILVDCYVKIYTKAEVIARWGAAAWHSGTPPLVAAVGCLGLTGAAPLPPLPAIPSAPPAAHAPTPETGAWVPGWGGALPGLGGVSLAGPAVEFLPGGKPETPAAFGGGPETATAFLPISFETGGTGPCQPGHERNGAGMCVEGYIPPTVSTPEPSTLLVMLGAIGALALLRRVWR